MAPGSMVTSLTIVQELGASYDLIVGKISKPSCFRGLALGILAIVAGCSGSEGSSGSTGTGQCQAACARCGADPCADCASYSARVRDDYEAALFSCVQNAAACSSAQWEACAVQAGTQTPTRAIDDQYRSACLAKKRMCDSAGSGFADDYCLSSRVFEESAVTQANGCLAQECAAARTCLAPIFK